MKVRITSVHSGASGTIVEFGCEAGEAAAIWKCAKAAPICSQEYLSELDVRLVLKIGENAVGVSGVKPSLELAGDEVLVTGLVESIGDDAVVCLRLSRDCLVLVESAGIGPEPGDMLRFTTKATSLQLWPMDL